MSKKKNKINDILNDEERYEKLRERLMDFVETVFEEDIMLMYNALEPKEQAKFLSDVIRKVIPTYSFDNTKSKREEIEFVQKTKENIAKLSQQKQGSGKIEIELTNPAKQTYKDNKELREKYADELEDSIEIVEEDEIEIEIEKNEE